MDVREREGMFAHINIVLMSNLDKFVHLLRLVRSFINIVLSVKFNIEIRFEFRILKAITIILLYDLREVFHGTDLCVIECVFVVYSPSLRWIWVY